MTNGISNLQPGEPNKLLDSILANLPTAIPVDAPIGQWHVDWFLWFIDTGVPYVVQLNQDEPLESLDWQRLGFSVYVQDAWDWLVGEFGYQWDINTLNWILAHWGDGGFVGDDIPITGTSGVFTTPDGLTGNTALGRIITTSNAINILTNLYGNAFKEKETSTTPTISTTTEPAHRGAYKVFETGTSNHRVYVKGDTVSYSNTTYSANKETKGGNRPDTNADWDKVSEADIIGIAITADAGLTGTMWTQNGFHYQNITVATGGITTAHIADNAITSSKIADGAILGVDVAVGVTLTNPDITGDAEVFGNVYITGTAAATLNQAQRNNPVLKISGTNRDIAIDCGAGVISAGYPSAMASSFHNFNISNMLSLGTSGLGISAGTSSILGYTGEFTDIISVKGLSAQDGLIDGLTGNFNNIVAHGGISASGMTLGSSSQNFLGLIASASGISAGLIHIDSEQAGSVFIDISTGISAEGNYIRGYTGTFKNVELVQGLSAQDGLIEGYTGEFQEIVAHSGISAEGATFGGAVNFTDGSVYMAGGLRHIGDTNTKILFGTGTVQMRTTDNIFLDATTTQVHLPLGISAEGATFGGDVIIHGGISAGTLVTGNTAEFTSLVGVKGVSAAGATIGGYWAGQHEEVIGININNGNDVLTTGTKGHRTIPYACDIIDWRVTSTDSGAIEWGINYATYANFPTMTAFSIHTSENPGIAATGSKDESAGNISARWTPYQIAAGTVIQFDIDSVTTLTNCIIELTIRRTG